MLNRIRQLRKQKNLSQKEFAKDFNEYVSKNEMDITPINFSVVSKWETRKSAPTKATYKALAKYFNVNEIYLRGAYSKEEIGKLVQGRRLDDVKQEKGRLFLIFMPVTSETIENYLIAIGVIPYDIPKEKDLLTNEQINSINFWVKNLELLYNDVAMQWLITKPSLDASKEDVLSAVNSAMNTVINASITSYNRYDAFNYTYEMDKVVENHYMQKRLEFLKKHEYWDDVEVDEGHWEEYPVYDFEHPHLLDGKKYYIEDSKHFYFDENNKRHYID